MRARSTSLSQLLIDYADKNYLGQRGLGYRLGFSITTIQSWIYGDRKPSLKACKRLCKVLGGDPLAMYEQTHKE